MQLLLQKRRPPVKINAGYFLTFFQFMAATTNLGFSTNATNTKTMLFLIPYFEEYKHVF